MLSSAFARLRMTTPLLSRLRDMRSSSDDFLSGNPDPSLRSPGTHVARHSGAGDPDCDKMYIFGGFEDETERFSQDVHCLHLTTMTWSQILTSGTSPSWRDFHTLSCIDDCLFVFGGRSGVEGPFHTRQEDYDNRVHMLDLKTMTWNTRPAGAGDPIGRRSHSAFVYHKCLYIFGGFHGADTNLHYNDLFKYDPKQ